MATSFNAKEHQARLHSYREYVPSPYFPASYGWKTFGGNGHILTTIQSICPSNDGLPPQEVSLIIVRDVLPTRFWVNKLGGWKEEFGYMKNAKFSLVLGEPQDLEFHKDWANAVGRINGATLQITGGPFVHNCIQTENVAMQIHFGAPVFEPLDPTANILDSIIQTWSVDVKHQAGLDQLKTTHRVNSLKVFDIDKSPVLPQHTSSALKGKVPPLQSAPSSANDPPTLPSNDETSQVQTQTPTLMPMQKQLQPSLFPSQSISPFTSLRYPVSATDTTTLMVPEEAAAETQTSPITFPFKAWRGPWVLPSTAECYPFPLGEIHDDTTNKGVNTGLSLGPVSVNISNDTRVPEELASHPNTDGTCLKDTGGETVTCVKAENIVHVQSSGGQDIIRSAELPSSLEKEITPTKTKVQGNRGKRKVEEKVQERSTKAKLS
ncbi:uncharacterized protein EV420DRAFT_1652250 [Desarmillaria tabescens]|uniref:Uncharacterized protein n=1 Tax=Armillaria tabescens TaxID=1929756 RepID=A0AA39MKQ4_ARMTA|nr:uncharacterized protein EV420DRAFT_1652250 [Desarmillaria tabescens]KAK0436970.1 hypothetical protein EV420DRAFT_1652250 [Desarmillaria tabescens]